MTEDLRARDLKHLWHPYTHTETFEAEPYLCIERGEGAYLYTTGGKALLDGIASWWCVAFGHGNPRLLKALHTQAGLLQQSILGNMAHPSAVLLAERLGRMCPGDLNYAYFASDGSSVTEAAMKMAVQYWAHQRRPEKTRFLSLEEGYHGDTFGAMGAGYISWFHAPYGSLVKPSLVAPTPFTPCNSGEPEEMAQALRAAEGLETLLKQHHQEIAAFIMEPLCQGAAGMRIYAPVYLQRARELCSQYEVLLIADEIAVGLGRTGALLACDIGDVAPDIVCLGKALTGGYLPMAVAVADQKIYDSFRTNGGERRVFFDGHTYCGNPITSALALEALNLIEEAQDSEALGARIAQLHAGIQALGAMPGVAYWKTLGMIGMFAIAEDAGGVAAARAISLHARELGLFVRPLGEVLYLWPPLNVTEDELAAMLRLLGQALASVCRT
ncbi:MAG: adenosylmethionine--8-amino-7-oxononanoate transaminase [Candidatus Hydrogenedentes bacterium]|nr:adenosylmethionine--8-amino-7-oxononanoate transaminase [Candidatus Hydrogenedentota bacterium]